MESANNRRLWVEGGLAFAATAALMFLGNGLNPVWWLVWAAPLPVLWFALRSPGWCGALVAGLAWLAGTLNLWGYIRVLGIPPLVWVGVFGLAALVFALAVMLFRSLFVSGRVWTALLALPSVWVAFEYGRNLAWPHGTAGSLAYSQLRFLPFLQLASLTGPWGMSFVLLLVPAGLAICFALWKREPRRARRVLSAMAGVLATVLIYGAVRLAMPQPGPEVRVGLIASDRNAAAAGTATEELLQAYAGPAEALAAQSAQVLVLPEKTGTATDLDVAADDAILQRVADRTGAVLVAGLDRESAAAAWNQARVYRPDHPVVHYEKEHLLPPFELRFTPGRSLLLLAEPQSPWGVAICKDMDFTQLSRKYGRAGAGLMLVPGWDFNVDRGWHGHIAVMRGVEDGFSVVRSAKDGYLTVSDDRGRILAEARSDSGPFATLMATVPSGQSRTPFLVLGDWFGWTAMGLTLLALLRAFAARRTLG